MRVAPAVSYIGEMRDLETISTALTAAETGHLVLATLHTPDAAQTVDRILDVFPPYQQLQVKIQLVAWTQCREDGGLRLTGGICDTGGVGELSVQVALSALVFSPTVLPNKFSQFVSRLNRLEMKFSN